MNPTLKNILAVVTGIFAGGAVNMGIIMLSPSIIPPPEGVDLTTMAGLQEGMALFTPKNFIMPFLAHAIGSLVGAFIAARMGARNHLLLALVVGVFFLIGGVSNVLMLPSPMWFNLLDLGVAYIPMAWLGFKLSGR